MTREAMLAKVPVLGERQSCTGRWHARTGRFALSADPAGGLWRNVLDPTRPLFDITLLGLAADGHTASLLPACRPAGAQGMGCRRIPWSGRGPHHHDYPVIESSRRVAFLVAGREKAAIFRTIRAGGSQVPAARVRPVGELIWFVDQAAAAED